MDGMVVEGRDYRFTTFQARESSLVAKRAAFPVKMLQDWVSEHSSFSHSFRDAGANKLDSVSKLR